MKLMSIKEYRITRFTDGSRPSERQIMKLIKDGEIPGVKRGKKYYVDIDAEIEGQTFSKSSGQVDQNILNHILKEREKHHG